MSVDRAGWSLPFDKTLATNMFRAESDRYNRKVGIVSTILLGGLAIAYICALVWSVKTGTSLDVSGNPYLYAVVLVGVAVLAVFVAVRPGSATAFRNRVAIRQLTKQYGGRDFVVETEGRGCDAASETMSFPFRMLR